MSAWTWIPTVASLFLTVVGAVPQKARADVQSDGFIGPVKFVFSTTLYHDIKWRQPDGVALVIPMNCLECDYDPAGARVRNGQAYENGFRDDNILLDHDEQGRLSERRTLDSSTGLLKLRESFGALGLTQQTFYQNGKVSSSRKLHYDLSGHLDETHSFDDKGQEIQHTRTLFSKGDILTDDSTWGSNGRLKYHMLYNPETRAQSLTTFDDAGEVKLTWSRSNDKMTSFWARSNEDNQYGACQGTGIDEAGIRETQCFGNGNQRTAVIREKFAAATSSDLKSAEWSDGANKLLYAAYYDYDFDSRHNWIRRRIWVISPELPERTLYQEDSRTITYW